MTDVTQKRQQVTYTVFLQGSVSTYILCVGWSYSEFDLLPARTRNRRHYHRHHPHRSTLTTPGLPALPVTIVYPPHRQHTPRLAARKNRLAVRNLSLAGRKDATRTETNISADGWSFSDWSRKIRKNTGKSKKVSNR